MNMYPYRYMDGYYVQKDTTNDTQGSERYKKKEDIPIHFFLFSL